MLNKPTLLLEIGLPASGKSTRAKEWLAEDPDGRVRINYDEMRLARYGPDWKFNRKQEDEVKAAALHTATEAIKAGLSVVIDNTNLSKNVRAGWEQIARDLGADYIDEEIDTPLHICIERDKARTGRARVGRAVIERMALMYGLIDWIDGDILIVDIDGTLADCRHRLHHIKPHCLIDASHRDYIVDTHRPLKCTCGGEMSKKNWPAFFRDLHLDKPIKVVVELVNRMADDHVICLVSGRDTSVGIATEDWLDGHGVQYDYLFLRGSGDHRPDYEHKLEILDLMPRHQVVLAFEDRDQCVKMYREQGIRCLQVGEGDF